MQTIDLQSWPRRVHYKTFRGFDHPHFNMCANVDVSPAGAIPEREREALSRWQFCT